MRIAYYYVGVFFFFLKYIVDDNQYGKFNEFKYSKICMNFSAKNKLHYYIK